MSSKVVIKVPFHDVDSMKVVWHGYYPKYFEVARTALLQEAQFDMEEAEAEGYLLPIIHMDVKYVAPIIFRQEIEVEISLVECEYKIKFEYIIRDLQTQNTLCKASTQQGLVDISTHSLVYPIPQFVIDRLEPYLG